MVSREIRGDVPGYVAKLWEKHNKNVARELNGPERDGAVFVFGMVYALRLTGVLPVDEDFVLEDAERLGVIPWPFV